MGDIAARMTPRAGTEEFLDRAGWGGAEISALAVDASNRRYFRVRRASERSVLMDAPPSAGEKPAEFCAIADYLLDNGFRPPRILSRDLDRGFVLLEDHGDTRMREFLDANPGEEEATYERAVAELLALREIEAAEVAPYDEAAYLREVELLTEWYLPALGVEADAAAYTELWRELLAPVIAAQAEPVTVLRDYHAENIMLINEPRLGLLDFQDALAGHPAYDLVSLLQDARRDVPEELERQMLDHYCAEAGEGDEFRAHYALLGAQRNAKIIGIFTRLWKRDGKPRYLSYMDRMWGLLERDLEHEALAPMKDWFDENIPADLRRKPLPGAPEAAT